MTTCTNESKICILGANGQVGMEVCLFLSEWNKVQVTPVCRTQYGSALLRRLGLDCRHGRLADEAQAAGLLQGASLVADFGWPTVTIGKMDAICRQIKNAIRNAPTGAPYVFISTQSVFHIDPAGPKFTGYRLSKRHAEKTAIREGRKAGRAVYVLRLGQVHGPLQSVSRAICREFRSEQAAVPALNSYAVFTYSIAEALVNIAAGREKPGTYTLIATPSWRWPEVHAYYARWTEIASQAQEEPVKSKTNSFWSRVRGVVREGCLSELFRHKEFIEYFGNHLFPKKMQRMRLLHYRRQAAAEVDQLRALQIWRPYGQKVEIPGVRLSSLSDVRDGIFSKNQWLLRRIQSASPSSNEVGDITR